MTRRQIDVKALYGADHYEANAEAVQAGGARALRALNTEVSEETGAVVLLDSAAYLECTVQNRLEARHPALPVTLTLIVLMSFAITAAMLALGLARL